MYTNILNQKAGRFIVISDIVNGNLNIDQLEKMVEIDMAPRKRKVPVVVEGRRFDSTTAGARWLANKYYATQEDRVVHRYRVQIRNWCNRDDTEGYYWAE